MDFRVLHLLGIETSDLDLHPTHRQQGPYPPDGFDRGLSFRLQRGRKPSDFAATIGEPCGSVSGLSAPSAATILPSLIELPFDIRSEMHFRLQDDLPIGDGGDPHRLGPGIDPNDCRLGIGGGLEAELNREWFTAYHFCQAFAQPVPHFVVPPAGHQGLSFTILNVDEICNGLLHKSSFRSTLFPSTMMMHGTFS